MKVVLIGDSIRMGYQPLVIEKCRGIDVGGPVKNCRHSLWALDHFQEWVADQEPDWVHVNFGIHDVSLLPDGEHQILLPQYRLCLQRFIAKVRELGSTQMIWATTTPLYVAEPDRPMAHWEIRERAELEVYNAAAFEVVQGEGLPINDLHDVIVRNDFSKCLREDGCHMTGFGNEVLSDAVAETIGTLMVLPTERTIPHNDSDAEIDGYSRQVRGVR
jgi:lysophospholipase L1-like esterase